MIIHHDLNRKIVEVVRKQRRFWGRQNPDKISLSVCFHDLLVSHVANVHRSVILHIDSLRIRKPVTAGEFCDLTL